MLLEHPEITQMLNDGELDRTPCHDRDRVDRRCCACKTEIASFEGYYELYDETVCEECVLDYMRQFYHDGL